MEGDMGTDVLAVLRRCEVFMGLDNQQLDKVAGLSSWRRRTCRAGELIFREGAAAREFYILEDGEVSLMAKSRREGVAGPALVAVDTVTTGNVFGWSSVVAPHSRTLSAVCLKPSRVVAVDGAELGQVLDRNPSLGYEVMKSLVRVIGARLRDLHHTLASKEGAASLERKAQSGGAGATS